LLNYLSRSKESWEKNWK